MNLSDQSTPEKILIAVQENILENNMAVAVRDLCRKLLEEKKRHVHLNLSQVQYLDSASIGMLLFIAKELKSQRLELHLDAVPPSLREVLMTSFVDRVIKIH